MDETRIRLALKNEPEYRRDPQTFRVFGAAGRAAMSRSSELRVGDYAVDIGTGEKHQWTGLIWGEVTG